jgi:hypothetical protein
MRAVSVMQPWASLIALGAKRYETRSWRTRHQGPLAIHASLTFPREARDLCGAEPFAAALRAAGLAAPGDLPRGAVIATCHLTACLPTVGLAAPPGLTAAERAFGNWAPGRWAWELCGVQRLPTPSPARGGLGLWTWTPPDDGVAPRL